MLAAPRPPREGPRARGGGGSFVAQRLAQAGLDSDFLSEPEPARSQGGGYPIGYSDADDIEAPSSDVYGRGAASRRDSRYGRQNWDDYDDGEVRLHSRASHPPRPSDIIDDRERAVLRRRRTGHRRSGTCRSRWASRCSAPTAASATPR